MSERRQQASRFGPKAAAGTLDLSMLPEKRDYRRIDAFAREFLRVPKGTGAGDPFILRGWQKMGIVRPLYPAGGKRPRQGLVSMPRGNGKTGLAAVIAMYGLCADLEMGAQVLTVASDERQARLIFDACRRMVELDARLADAVQVYGDRLYMPSTDSTLRPLPAEPAALQGWDPTLVVVDELHVVTPAVWEAVSGAAGKRAESLTLAISTPADRTDSIMWQLVEHGRRGDDPSFVLVEHAAPAGCALDDRDAWKIANPALGDFLHADAMLAVMRTMREEAFRRYRLGQWVGTVDSWLPWGLWDSRADTGRGMPADGETVCLAFDGSASGDSTALVGCTLDGHIFVVAMWEAPEHDPSWRVPRREVAGMIAAAFDRWTVRELAADPWGWRTELEEWADTYPGVVEWNTAHAGRMAPATDRLYAALVDGDVTHDGDERLAAHVNHCVRTQSAMGDLVKKDKRNSTRKIDAAVAAIVAHDRAAWHRANPPKRRRAVGIAS